jgi:hypothetical protein
MPKFDTPVKIALIAAVLFVVVGYQATYNATQGVFGKIVGGMNYGNGNTVNDRGVLLHAVVLGAVMWAVSKYYLKLS